MGSLFPLLRRGTPAWKPRRQAWTNQAEDETLCRALEGNGHGRCSLPDVCKGTPSVTHENTCNADNISSPHQAVVGLARWLGVLHTQASASLWRLLVLAHSAHGCTTDQI